MVSGNLYGDRLSHGLGSRFNFEYMVAVNIPPLGYTTIFAQSSLPYKGVPRTVQVEAGRWMTRDWQ